MNRTTLTDSTQDHRLHGLAQRATERYPESAHVIAKALGLAQEERVALVNSKLAFVESSTYPGQYYRIEGKVCSCPARVEKCAHRFAVALTRLAQSEETLPVLPITDRHYASLLTADGPVLGYADYGDKGWVFYAEESTVAQYVDVLHLTLLGNEVLADTQRATDGNLLEQVRARFDYGNGAGK
jgi:hypothetical protein